MNKPAKKGFTLIELLVVISIISLLATLAVTSLQNARIKSRMTRRAADLRQIRTALELYYDNNGGYPTASSWRSECNAWGGFTSDNVIPGLVPTYMGKFPTDPAMDKTGNRSCYIYYSNGTDYKVLDHDIADGNYQNQPSLIDPYRDGGGYDCIVNGTGIWSWAIYSPGGCGW